MTSPNAVAGVIKRGALVHYQSSFNSIGTYTASILFCNNYTVYTNYPIINPSVLLIGKTIGFVAYVQQALFQNHLSLLPICELNVIKNTYSVERPELGRSDSVVYHPQRVVARLYDSRRR